MDEMRESLGLSRSEIQRVRVFGTAMGKAIMITDRLEKRQYEKVTPDKALNQLNALSKRLNESLGR